MAHIRTFHPTLAWRIGNTLVDARLVPMLAAVRASGSLAAAARACAISYRAAWDLLGRHAAAGATLVTMERGRGARLTALAESLLEADTSGRALVERIAPVRALSAQGPAGAARAPVQEVRLIASHDLLLERALRRRGKSIEVTFAGSLEALAAFARGDADAAGFHVAAQADLGESPRAFLHYLNARRDALLPIAVRTQGLIVPPGNPRRVTRLDQIARRHLRFVNRQRGSGTRLLVDALLRRASVRPSAIEGYGSQAHTHRAVAQAVASGAADVGFGLAAAAAELALGFVPIAHERYFIAIRRKALGEPRLEPLFASLERGRLTRHARALAGYTIPAAIAAVSVNEAFRSE